MFKNLLLCCAVLSIAFLAACQQANPTLIHSTRQTHDNKSSVNHNSTNHSEINRSETNTQMMNSNSMSNSELKPTTNAAMPSPSNSPVIK